MPSVERTRLYPATLSVGAGLEELAQLCNDLFPMGTHLIIIYWEKSENNHQRRINP